MDQVMAGPRFKNSSSRDRLAQGRLTDAAAEAALVQVLTAGVEAHRAVVVKQPDVNLKFRLVAVTGLQPMLLQPPADRIVNYLLQVVTRLQPRGRCDHVQPVQAAETEEDLHGQRSCADIVHHSHTTVVIVQTIVEPAYM